MDSGKENPQVIALTDKLKQKEAEIEDLKRLVDQYPVNVWSVSTDDPSNPTVNLTGRGSTAWMDGTEGSARKEDGGQLHGSANYKDGDNSTRGENEFINHREGENSAGDKDGSENGQRVTDRRQMTGEEELQKPDNSRDEGFQDGGTADVKKDEDSRNGGGFGVGGEENNSNATKATDEDTDIKAMDDKEHGSTRNGQQGKPKNSADGAGREFGTISKGGMKLEMSEISQNGAGSRVRGRHGYASKTKAKRWRVHAKNRGLEHNGDSENMRAGSMRIRRFFKAEQESESFNAPSLKKLEKSGGHKRHKIDLKTRDKSSQEDGKPEISEKFKQGEGKKDDKDELEGRENGKDNRMQERKAGVSSEAKLLNPQNPEDVDNLRNKVENANNHEMVSIHGNSGKPHYSLNEDVSTNSEANNIIGDAGKQKLDEELRQLEDQEASSIRQNMKSKDINKVENNDEDEELEDLEIAEIHEQETDAANGDVFRESESKMEDDGEEYNEETDESEF